MAEAKKTKSGNWTCLVYSHTETVNGKPKRIYQRFTAEKKKDCERMAKDFEVNRKQQKTTNELTVSDAIERYIDLKTNVLSPSTIRSYRLMQKSKFPLIGNIKLNRLTNEQIQSEINQESANYSPKYIRNIYGLLTAALEMFAPNFPVHVSYPENRQKEIVIPTAAEISHILELCTNISMTLAIMLAAYLGLRRGEISGLKVSDIDLQKNTIHICRSVVLSPEKEWIEKVPKTKSGRRTLSIPDILRDTLEYAVKGKTQTDAVVALSPSQISDNFQTLAKNADIPQVTFHALRHYNASFMLASGIPNKYAMQRMGHATENMLQRVYQHTISEKEQEITDQINQYLSNTFSH